jgi:hypothetical protein
LDVVREENEDEKLASRGEDLADELMDLEFEWFSWSNFLGSPARSANVFLGGGGSRTIESKIHNTSTTTSTVDTPDDSTCLRLIVPGGGILLPIELFALPVMSYRRAREFGRLGRGILDEDCVGSN